MLNLLSLLIVLGCGIVLFFFLVIVSLVLFGSSVDPDDNGILRTSKQKEKYRQYKLNKFQKDK